MKVKTLTINSINLSSFDPKTKEFLVEIELDNEQPLKCKMILTRNFETMTHKLIEYIKTTHKPKVDYQDDDEILGTFAAVQITNDEEELFEAISKGFARVESRLFAFQKTTEAGSYMKQLDIFRTFKETIYKKKPS